MQSLDDLAEFKEEVAGARTFVFVREIEELMKHGLIKGGDLDNAIVIYDLETTQENVNKICELMDMPPMHLEHLGYINPRPLKWDNEPARHKLMDVLGDLSLIGRPLKGRVVAIRPGHSINTRFARMLRKEVRHTEVQSPLYNPGAQPLIDVNGIKKLLPHRYPFLLIDKIIEPRQTSCCGSEERNRQRAFLPGSFPAGTGDARRASG